MRQIMSALRKVGLSVAVSGAMDTVASDLNLGAPTDAIDTVGILYGCGHIA